MALVESGGGEGEAHLKVLDAVLALAVVCIGRKTL